MNKNDKTFQETEEAHSGKNDMEVLCAAVQRPGAYALKESNAQR